jgi:hypothetical protein
MVGTGLIGTGLNAVPGFGHAQFTPVNGTSLLRIVGPELKRIEATPRFVRCDYSYLPIAFNMERIRKFILILVNINEFARLFVYGGILKGNT